MLQQLVKLLKALNSNRNPSEIANACCMGVILGFMPKNNALWFLVFVFFLFVRVNKPAYLIITALVSQFAWHLDPLFSSLGYTILTYDKLTPFFGRILEVPFVGFTRFNNTIVMGSLACGLALYIPLFMLIRYFVLLWRKQIAPRIGDTIIMKTFSKVPFIQKLIELTSERF